MRTVTTKGLTHGLVYAVSYDFGPAKDQVVQMCDASPRNTGGERPFSILRADKEPRPLTCLRCVTVVQRIKQRGVDILDAYYSGEDLLEDWVA